MCDSCANATSGEVFQVPRSSNCRKNRLGRRALGRRTRRMVTEYVRAIWEMDPSNYYTLPSISCILGVYAHCLYVVRRLRAVGDGEAVDCAVHADCGSSGEVWTSLADLADIAGLLLHVTRVTKIDDADHVIAGSSRLKAQDRSDLVENGRTNLMVTPPRQIHKRGSRRVEAGKSDFHYLTMSAKNYKDRGNRSSGRWPRGCDMCEKSSGLAAMEKLCYIFSPPGACGVCR
jgi:hypothetical protein